MALSVGKAEESGGCGSTACSPCTQTSLVPRLLESVAWARLREGLQEGEARKERLLGVRAVAPACQPLSPLSLALPLGVPLLFVIPWGIVKYLYEDEG